MLQSERLRQTVNRVLQIVVLVYQGITLLAFVAVPFLAIHWLQTPFLGAFVEQTMVFNAVGQDTPSQTWSLFQDKSLWLNYQLIKVNGVGVQNEAQIHAALANTQPGQTLPVVLRRLADGQTTIRPVTLQGARPVLALVLADIAWQRLFEAQLGADVAAVQTALGPNVPVVGGYTLGQILPRADAPSQFLNQHMLVIVFRKPQVEK